VVRAIAGEVDGAGAVGTAGGEGSSARFFLNRVSVMGRKNVQSNVYCLQCLHLGGSESGIMSQRIFRERHESHAREVFVRFLFAESAAIR
jgi:hypothetical protein